MCLIFRGPTISQLAIILPTRYSPIELLCCYLSESTNKKYLCQLIIFMPSRACQLIVYSLCLRSNSYLFLLLCALLNRKNNVSSRHYDTNFKTQYPPQCHPFINSQIKLALYSAIDIGCGYNYYTVKPPIIIKDTPDPTRGQHLQKLKNIV